MEAIIKVEKMSPSEIYEGNNIELILSEIKKEALSFIPDTTTKKGQAEIKSLASKVARSKTFLDGEGKKLADELNAKLKPINGLRKKVRETLDELKEEVRKPVTIIENIEKERVAKLQERLKVFDLDVYELLYNSKNINKAIENISKVIVDESWQEFELKADKLKIECIETLTSKLKETQEYEAKQAEIEAEKQKQLVEKIRKEEEQKAKLKYEQEEQRKKQQELFNKQSEEQKKLGIEASENAKVHLEKCEAELINDLMVSLFMSKIQAKAFVNEIADGKIRHLKLDY